MGLESIPFSHFSNSNIQAGDIVFRQDTNKMIKLSQQVLTKGSGYASATHAGIVVKISEKSISILESNPSGVKVKNYTEDEFRDFIGKELHLLKKRELNDHLQITAASFAKRYGENSDTKYAYKHFVSCALQSVKDNKKSRKRTLNSLKNLELMNSKGKARGAICSELVAEIVKVAQLSKVMTEDKRELTAEILKEMQKKGVVLNVSSENVSPGELEKLLVKKCGFEKILIKNLLTEEEEIVVDSDDDSSSVVSEESFTSESSSDEESSF